MVLTVVDDSSLVSAWETIVAQSDIRTRSIWIVFLNSSGRVFRQLAVVSDIEPSPSRVFSEAVMRSVREVLMSHPRGSAAFLIARPGAQRVSPVDCDWAASLTWACQAWGVSTWPVAIAAASGIHVVTQS